MVPTSFEESNGVLSKPAGMSHEQCEALSVWRGLNSDGVPLVISCWKLTKDEVERLIATGKLWLYVCGETMPPVILDVNSPFERTTA